MVLEAATTEAHIHETPIADSLVIKEIEPIGSKPICHASAICFPPLCKSFGGDDQL